ncbi:MAG: hypothetical protein PVF74_07960 [Anaerolineales bacterium]|jgi:hypothetical protein
MTQTSGILSKQFLIWVFANVLGFGALGAMHLVFPALIMRFSGLIATIATALAISIPISLAQWIALRRILQTSVLWILTIPIGLLLTVLIIRVIPDGLWLVVDDESIAALTTPYLVFGFIIGLLQWLILRRQLLRSSIWLLGSSIGAVAGIWLILVTDLINQSGIISYIIAVMVYSIVTGLVLSWLLIYHNQSQTNLATAAQPQL